MLSRPANVDVNSAGVVTASVASSPSPPLEDDEHTSDALPIPGQTPWTIGSTDGTYAAMQLSRHSVDNGLLSPIEDDGDHGGEVAAEHTNSNTNSNTNGGGKDDERTTPSPAPHTHNSSSDRGAVIGAGGEATTLAALSEINAKRSLFHDRLINPPSSSVEACLQAACEVMGFDIAEMWLRTGAKTHQLTNSHLRPAALDNSARSELVDVYYGERSSERTHLLSPALCKRAKEAKDVIWVTAHTPSGAEALRMSISDVRTAVAVPVCHEASNTNITIIYFSIRRSIMNSTAVEFLAHLSLAAAVASVNDLDVGGSIDNNNNNNNTGMDRVTSLPRDISQSEHVKSTIPETGEKVNRVTAPRLGNASITGASLDLRWGQLHNVEYLTDGGNNWIHTAVLEGKPVVVKTLKPECQDVALAINEIEGELAIHSRLNHPNICSLIGAGLTSKGVRFVVLERLDGGTMSQMLGYEMRIRDRRRRFWRKRHFSYLDVLRCARSLADAMNYLHGEAVPGCMVLHRDLKPDNIGFTLAGEVKLIDFGLARIIEGADPSTDEVYEMSGETGSLRYMAPEVARSLSYNHKADVYSFGIIFWELNAFKKPFVGMTRDDFYERVVNGGERPPLTKKWPNELKALMASCWNEEPAIRPTFKEILQTLDHLLAREKGGTKGVTKKAKTVLTGLIDRHSTWF